MESSTAPVVLITGRSKWSLINETVMTKTRAHANNREGANQGLGFNFAKVLSNSKVSYTILVASRNSTRGEEAVAKLLETKSNPQTTFSSIILDVSSSESIAAAIAKITADHGRLDILINNAGVIFGPDGSTSKRSDWNAIFDVNVFGAMELTQSAFPLLKKSAEPKVVVVSSNVGSLTLAADGHVPMAGYGTPYTASKAAINMVMLQWKHTQPDVKFWGVCPGLCATEIGGDFTKKYGRDPYEAADIVRQIAEGERDQGIGRVSWQEKGLKFGDEGVYDW